MKLQTWLKHNWLVAVSFAAMLGLSLFAWPHLDGPLPVHWGLNGEPDRFGSKLEALGLFPLLAFLSYVLWNARGKTKNTQVFAVFKTVFILGFALMHIGIVLGYLGSSLSINNVIALGVGIVWVVFGNFMPKVEPNRWVGLRAPWIFKSKKTWYKTQWLGGWVFSLSGVAFILVGLFSKAEWIFLWTLSASLLSILAVFVYSYSVWRNDKDPEPALD